KAKFAQIVGKHVNDLYFGQTMSSGQKLTALDEAQSVPAVSPYAITVTNSGQFVDDWGVRYFATGLPLTKVLRAHPCRDSTPSPVESIRSLQPTRPLQS